MSEPESAGNSSLLKFLRGVASLIGTVVLIGLVVVFRVARHQAGPELGLAISIGILVLAAIAWFVFFGAQILVSDSKRERPSKKLAIAKLILGLSIATFALVGVGPQIPLGVLPSGYLGFAWSSGFAALVALGTHGLLMGVQGWRGCRPSMLLRLSLAITSIMTFALAGPALSRNYRASVIANGRLFAKELPRKGYQEIKRLMFSPDGEQLLGVGEDGSIELWDTNDWKIEYEGKLKTRSADFIGGIDIARDLKTVAWSSGMQCDVNIENVNSNEPVFHVDGNKGKYVSAIAVSHDDQWAALAIESKIDVWNLQRKEKIVTLEGHDGKVHSVAFVGTDNLVSCGQDGTVRMWGFRTGQGVVFANIERELYRLIVSPNQQLVAASAEKDGIRVWDIESKKQIQHYFGHGSAHTSFQLTFAPDGKHIASARGSSISKDQLCVWDVTTGRVVYTRLFSNAIGAMAFHPVSSQLVVAPKHVKVQLWNVSLP